MVLEPERCGQCGRRIGLSHVGRTVAVWKTAKRPAHYALCSRKRTFHLCLCPFNRLLMHLPITGDLLLRLIPQREPIVMVSGLEEYSETHLISSFVVKDGHLFVDGQGLAESGLLEHMAQSVALHTGYGFFLRNEEAPVGYIGSMQSAEINSLPRIGQTVYGEVTKIGRAS